jgi:hypothetical protein
MGRVNAVRVAAVQRGAEGRGGSTRPDRSLVSQHRPSARDTVFAYGLPGTASEGEDVRTPSGAVMMEAGDVSSIVILDVRKDGRVEGLEMAVLTLTAVIDGDPASVLGRSTPARTAEALIEDDEVAVIVPAHDLPRRRAATTSR